MARKRGIACKEHLRHRMHVCGDLLLHAGFGESESADHSSGDVGSDEYGGGVLQERSVAVKIEKPW